MQPPIYVFAKVNIETAMGLASYDVNKKHLMQTAAPKLKAAAACRQAGIQLSYRSKKNGDKDNRIGYLIIYEGEENLKPSR